MNQYTEDEILDMYFNRNEDAVTVTANRYGCGLIRFAKRMIGSEDALECVNDTYLTAWRRIPPERPQKFQAWLYKVLRNIVCDRIDWNNADKRNSEGYAMLDELAVELKELAELQEMPQEQMLAGFKERVAGRLVGHIADEPRTNLNPADARMIVESLFACENPYVTPSGRKCVEMITLEELDKRLNL